MCNEMHKSADKENKVNMVGPFYKKNHLTFKISRERVVEGRFYYLGPNRNDNWCVNTYVTTS